MSGLEILSIPPSASFQDQGRTGYLRYGVTSSGAMDLYALREGQVLLGNAPDDAALEMAQHGGRFRAHAPLVLATSGAEMVMSVNGAPMAWRRSFALEAGDMLDIGAAVDGVYGYLHVPGGFQTPVVLGSRSTHLRAGFGQVPMAGQMLQAGRPMRKPLPRGLPRPDYFEQRVFRVLWGPQSTYFSAAERQRFIGATFEVTKMRDRMGIQVRPDSGPVAAAAGLTIASDAINPGDFQVTGDGTPAILLADRGSSGGYPRIATLITADFPGLAQIPTGDSFQLHLISREEAVELLAAFRARLNALPRQMQPLLRDPRDIADLLAYNLIDGALRGDEYDGD